MQRSYHCGLLKHLTIFQDLRRIWKSGSPNLSVVDKIYFWCQCPVILAEMFRLAWSSLARSNTRSCPWVNLARAPGRGVCREAGLWQRAALSPQASQPLPFRMANCFYATTTSSMQLGPLFGCNCSDTIF